MPLHKWSDIRKQLIQIDPVNYLAVVHMASNKVPVDGCGCSEKEALINLAERLNQLL